MNLGFVDVECFVQCKNFSVIFVVFLNVSLLGIMFVYSSRCLHLYDNIKKSQLLCLLVAKKI